MATGAFEGLGSRRACDTRLVSLGPSPRSQPPQLLAALAVTCAVTSAALAAGTADGGAPSEAAAAGTGALKNDEEDGGEVCGGVLERDAWPS